ncbi:MAG: hypothetical protein ABIQ27_01845 [Flavobacterium sp.]|uniref:LA_2272 family surface repeat-containing protein n=1 Tax=Flavobacterium sp. TaxID=239 RepID=UPI0032650AC9
MKTKFLFLLMILSLKGFSQDNISIQITPLKTQAFSLSPMSSKLQKVNGLVFGLGHIDNKKISRQTINGLNLEANPAPIAGAFAAFLMVMYLPEIIKNGGKQNDTLNGDLYLKVEDWDKTPFLKLNGISISSGCFFVPTSMNGLNISFANKFKNFNGLSIAPLGTMSDRQTGVSVGLANVNNDMNGFTAGFYNQSLKLDGLQVGIINFAKTNHGLQVGLFNRSYSRGFQVGVWNVNKKRSLPFINW